MTAPRHQPKMLGAHTPKPLKQKRRQHLYAFGRDFNEAYDRWARGLNRTHLVYRP